MNSHEEMSARRRLQELVVEHRDLDQAIDRMGNDLEIDDFLVRRLKKRKLQLKDTITKLESSLIPDLDA